MKFIATARAHAKPNRTDLTDNHKLGRGTWHLEKTNLLQGVCLYTPISLCSLSLPLRAPLSRLTVTWLFHFMVSAVMVVKRENSGAQPISFDRNSSYVCQWAPLWSILFRYTAEMWIPSRGHYRTETRHEFQSHSQKSPKQSSQFLVRKIKRSKT